MDSDNAPEIGNSVSRMPGAFCSGGGIGIFEDRSVEPLILAFFRHYLLEGNKDLFTGEGVSNSTGKTTSIMHQ